MIQIKYKRQDDPLAKETVIFMRLNQLGYNSEQLLVEGRKGIAWKEIISIGSVLYHHAILDMQKLKTGK